MTALSTNAKNRLTHALASQGAATEVVNILNVANVLSSTEAGFIDGVTAGTAAASKALVLDANKDIATIRHITISGNLVTGSTTLSETELGVVDGVTAGTAAASKALVLSAGGDISTITSATITTLTNTSIVRTGLPYKIGVGAKAGTTAGWTVGAGNNIGTIATVAASQTAATLVVPVIGLHVGDTITAFRVVASINSAGNTVTLDADLRKMTVAAGATATDASVATMTQVSVTGATAQNSTKTGLTEVVAASTRYYFLLTATTASSTTIELDDIEYTVTSA